LERLEDEEAVAAEEEVFLDLTLGFSRLGSYALESEEG
jgi:hypothetical protein